MQEVYHYDEEPCHKLLYPQIKQKLAYDESKDYATWKQEVRTKFIELSGLDLACLIAPGNLSVIAGVKDNIFPIDGVRRDMKRCRRYMPPRELREACSLTVTPREHWLCEDIVWGEIARVTEKLGW